MSSINSRIEWELGLASTECTFHGVDDIEAIATYFANASPINLEATNIKDEFANWYSNLWWVEKTTQGNFDLARNLRNRFNLANAATPEEKKKVAAVIQTGMSEEQILGVPDRRLSDGMLPGPQHPPKDPMIPTPWLIGGAIVGGLAIVVAAHGAASSGARTALTR